MSTASAPSTASTIEPLGIECTSLVHLYPMDGGDVVALRGVDLDVEPGEMVALLGPSGTGKSTLLRIMAGIIRPSSGEVRVGGRDIARLSGRELRRYRATEVGIVLQEPMSNLLAYATVVENLLFASRGARSHGQRRLRSPGELLEVLGLEERAGRRVSTLSGGEQRLAALAAGAVSGSALLLVDEPTGSLDPAERDRVIDALGDLHRASSATVVVVTHDPILAASIPRTVTIRDGRVGAEGRHGTQFAVVGRDGTIQLPPDLLDVLPPDTLVRLVRHPHSVELRGPDADTDALIDLDRDGRQS